MSIFKSSKKLIYMSANGLGASIAAGGTSYLCAYLDGLLATERGMPISRPGAILMNLYFRILSAQPPSGSLVVTVRNTGISTPFILTIPANSPGLVTYSETILTYAIPNLGDSIGLMIVNNAAAGSTTIGAVSLDCLTD